MEKLGLTSKEALKKAQIFGKNEIKVKRSFSLPLLLFSQYRNFITLILLSAAIFSIAISEFVDAFFILFVLFGMGLFGFVQEYRAEKTLQKLKDLIVPFSRLIRDSKEIEIDSREIVPADIVILSDGDKIAADGVLITDIAFEVDESILTGESLPLEKKKGDLLFSGTFVVRGKGYMRVKKIGLQTRIGEIAKELEQGIKPKIPLAESLNNLGKKIAVLAGILSVFLFLVGNFQGRDPKELIITTVSLAVAAIPEGLPLVVTIALAVGAFRMTKRKTITRKIASIETLGSTSVILTDKTGTITQNQMSVKKYFAKKEDFSYLLRACALGNTATLVQREKFSAKGGPASGWDVLGDKTDGALLSFANQNVENLSDFRNEGKVLEEKPFDPQTKTVEIVWEENEKKHVFVRGAPESILKIVNEKQKEEIKRRVEALAKEGLRIIAFAHKEKNEFSFLGLVAIYDPPRKEARLAIKEAEQAGIRVVMVTGDSPITALKIAEEINLIKEGELVLTSDDIKKMKDDEILKDIPRIRIFARMLPKDKLRLVSLYQKAGHVVAVTGDGVNDALALSKAHIGVAMGQEGTDIAKEASDIIITDDNLYTIIKAVEEGRGIFDNIIKVVVFLFSSNIAEFSVIFLAVLFGLPIPLSPTQILWVNLVGDGFPALALSTDTKRKNLLFRKPRDIKEQILNSGRIKLIAAIAMPFSIILLTFYFFTLSQTSSHYARLSLFNLLVLGEMIIVFIVRGGIFPINKFLIFSIVLVVFFQLIINLNPFLRGVFS